jgi:hypothetical protein
VSEPNLNLWLRTWLQLPDGSCILVCGKLRVPLRPPRVAHLWVYWQHIATGLIVGQEFGIARLYEGLVIKWVFSILHFMNLFPGKQ